MHMGANATSRLRWQIGTRRRREGRRRCDNAVMSTALAPPRTPYPDQPSTSRVQSRPPRNAGSATRGHPSTFGQDNAMTSADPSQLTPVRKRAYNAKRPCSAHSSRIGEPCRRPTIEGGTVCGAHGGRASAVKRKARQRLEEGADRMARQLLKISESGESESVRLAAIKYALDRADIQAQTAATV
jgi:hypothetical protein